MQAIHSTRPGGHVGFVGVSHDVAIPGDELFMAGVHIHGGPAPVRQYLPELIQLIWDRTIDPGKVFDLTLPAGPGRRGLPGHGPAHRHQGPAHPLTRCPTSRTMLTAVPDRSALTALLARRVRRRSRHPRRPRPGCGRDESTDSPAARRPGHRSTQPRQRPGQQTQEDHMKIQITIGEQRFDATLTDSAAARDLVAQLPVTVDMIDHGGVEKTGPLPAPLSLEGQPEGADPDVGDLGYYAPGNDLVLYYGDQSYFPGIVILGRLDGDAAAADRRHGRPGHRDRPGAVTAMEAAGLPRPREQRRADRRRLASSTGSCTARRRTRCGSPPRSTPDTARPTKCAPCSRSSPAQPIDDSVVVFPAVLQRVRQEPDPRQGRLHQHRMPLPGHRRHHASATAPSSGTAAR